jgi:hypothetical protein
LKRTGGKVFGPGGAAELLGMKAINTHFAHQGSGSQPKDYDLLSFGDGWPRAFAIWQANYDEWVRTGEKVSKKQQTGAAYEGNQQR